MAPLAAVLTFAVLAPQLCNADIAVQWTLRPDAAVVSVAATPSPDAPIVVLVSQSEVRAVPSRGDVTVPIWKAAAPSESSFVCTAFNNATGSVLLVSPGLLTAYRVTDGFKKWQTALPIGTVAGECLVLSSDSLTSFVADGSRIVAVDVATGRMRWNSTLQDHGAVLAGPVYADGAVWVAVASAADEGKISRVVALDAGSGSVRSSVAPAPPASADGVQSLALNSLGQVVLCSGGSLFALAAAGDGSALWTWPWRVLSPLGVTADRTQGFFW